MTHKNRLRTLLICLVLLISSRTASLAVDTTASAEKENDPLVLRKLEWFQDL